ncbi:MAG: hypothetical protein LHW56_00210 [Candidatus Cloacimonetes bacterium]|nr:hypothetical protein [Candidatus Cloacimonadota bacterium]MDY0171307.1 hypothetical protein [Candidatus Cloacimonadaceae bacterium]
MKGSLPSQDKYAYLISLGLHALILVIFALISLNVKTQTKWQQFDWILESEPVGADSPYPSANAGTPQAAGEKATPAKAVSAEESQSFHDIESPLLEIPTETKTRIQTTPSRDSRLTQALSPTQSTGGGEGNASGFSLSLIDGGSDAYFIHETKPKITPLEDDVVIVEFSLSAEGRVKMNNLNVISYRRAAHWEALREEMRSWRFGFTGAYKPEKRYRIRCNFKLR